MKFRWRRFILHRSDFTFPLAIAVMLEKQGIALDLMHGFNLEKWTW
jgi:hypothetical protein